VSRSSTNWCSRLDRLAIYIRDGFCCLWCLKDLREAMPTDITLDHLTPHCFGGSDRSTNLITACRSCNSRRRHMAWREFARTRCDAGTIPRILRHARRKLNYRLARAMRYPDVAFTYGTR
jgi:5-methylcytosine-specific restriction protein A